MSEINIDELQLEAPITDVDNFLMETSIKYKLPALLISSIVMARLMHLNNQFDTTGDFKNLLQAIIGGIENKEFNIPDKGNMH
jgi:hypothetical protein